MNRKIYLAAFLIPLTMLLLGASRSWGITLSGVAKDQKGGDLPGVMVTAYSETQRMATSVITDEKGKYEIVGLAEGDYLVRAKRLGFKNEEKKLALTGDAGIDFALEEAADISEQASSSDWLAVLPDGPGDVKKRFIIGCIECHGMEKIVENRGKKAEEWHKLVDSMVNLGQINRKTSSKATIEALGGELGTAVLFPGWFGLDAITSYLAEHFGANHQSLRPKIPPPVTGAAARVVITEWDLPKINSANTHTVAVDPKTGLAWIIDSYAYGELIRLDPSTGATKTYKLPVPPGENRAGAHDVVFDKEGKIWLPLIVGNAIVQFDPATEAWTTWKPPTPNSGPHTLRLDSQGNVWFTQFAADQFARLDPKTGEFVEYKLPSRRPIKMPYGLTVDPQDNVWVCELYGNRLTRFDPRTGKITSYTPPTPYSSVRRADFDSQGNIWFSEFVPGKLGKFDPKTETFQEYAIPTPDSAPYGIAVDREADVVWASGYASHKIIQFDIKTETFTEYPLPTPILSNIRNVWVDRSTGTVWGVYGNWAKPNARLVRLKFPKLEGDAR
ncbi:MAG: carboxypeptidase regulatory-like domain-containing protein [Candidatus Tectomicrobia bacterium]|uniref:Carboxypeptidase regulatory-like domain-containing protein n=1 Tax=Tectimicrobiota bacterium TaxID=2528274 RepID=A0A932CQI2_UNCTE|nr:carboxypeptidase regulatory-like domain-containing protein [Candidatus Tectomicrobia bacterium]